MASKRVSSDGGNTYQKIELNKNVFHYFNEVDTPKELSSPPNSFFSEVDIGMSHPRDDLVSFFRELDASRRTMLRHLISWFNELDTRKGTMLRHLVSFFKELDASRRTMLRMTLFHFLGSLTQVDKLCSDT